MEILKSGMNQKRLLSLVILFFLVSGGMAQHIPYPDALEEAAIVQPSISSLDTNGLIIGNGDINALIYSEKGQLVMHTAKNDVWDARLITKNDPPLLRVDISNDSWLWGGRPESWNYPYPTQTPPVLIKIGEVGNMVNSRINLRRGKASITSDKGEITIRALAGENVFYFETDKMVRMEGFPQDFLPGAERSRKGDVLIIKQNLPGDPDYPGMDVYSALKSRGNRHAVSIVTSRESSDPGAEAIRLAERILSQNADKIVEEHENIWETYWSKSGVKLGDPDFQNWWYRQLYYLRCLSKPGVYPIALQGGYNRKANWHGTWTMNYNAEQTFWPSFNTNHVGLSEPFIDLVYDYRSRARFYAKTVFNCEGGVTPHNFWPFEPDPATCKSVNKRQLAFMPWSYGIGTAGHIAHILWLHYAYSRDETLLKEKIYPVIKDYALFYASFIEKCREVNGKVLFGPSVDPEHTPFGWYNSPYDLAWAKHTLKAAIRGANILDVDRELVERWNESLKKLPWYPVSEGVVKVGERESGYNIITPVVPVFPAEQVSFFSPEAEKALFKNTINWINTRYNHNNSVVMLNVARARLSMTDAAIKDTRLWFKDKEQPNGLFYWQAHGFYMSEQTAVAGLITEFLMQSVEDVVRIFPSWPRDMDAAFVNLRAQGGFLVSARQENGVITGLKVESAVGGELKLVSPWKGISVKYPDGRVTTLSQDDLGIVKVNTSEGQVLEFIQSR